MNDQSATHAFGLRADGGMPTVTGWINAFFPYLEAIENGLEERIARAEAAEVGVAVAVAVKRLDKALASLTPTDTARNAAWRDGGTGAGSKPEGTAALPCARGPRRSTRERLAWRRRTGPRRDHCHLCLPCFNI